MAQYAFGDSSTDDERLSLLSKWHDNNSMEWFNQCIKGNWSGRKILLVGAGGFGLAKALSEKVGPKGKVLVTDIANLQIPLELDPWIKFKKFDVVKNFPPICEHFDIVHARLLLGHLEDPLKGLTNMLQLVSLGGTIVLEDLDKSTAETVQNIEPFDECRRMTTAAVAKFGYRDIGKELFAMLLNSSIASHVRGRGIVQFETGGEDSNMQLYSRQYQRLVKEGMLTGIPSPRLLEEAVSDPNLVSQSSMMIQVAANIIR